MRWKRVSDFVVAVILSIAYFYLALLNFIGPMHEHLIHVHGVMIHPMYSLVYFIVALAISWGLYFSIRKKPSFLVFIISILVGLALIIVGTFLWDIAMYFSDTVVRST